MSAEARLLRIAIDAHLVSGEYGGVEQVIIGLAHGLSGLSDDGEEYFFLTYEGSQSWLERYVNGPCSIVTTAPSPIVPRWKRLARSIAPSLAPAWRRLRYSSSAPLLGPPQSAGVAESLGADVFHFPQQQGVLTEIPSVYQPHDLQHLHLGEFFTAEQVAAREAMYRPMCDQASMVSVTSEWGRRDLIEHYGLAEDKVVVIQLAPVLGAYTPPSSETVDALLARHKLPEQFIFYPAQTWPHKNHLRLAEALAILRAEGLDVPLVSVGRLNDHYEEIRARVRELGVTDLTHFLGFVGSDMLPALYARATAVVIPSMFEASGGFGPMSEAFLAGAPVACSNVTSLPAEAGDAALIFDPTDERAIAAAIRALWTDPVLRSDLAARGRLRVSRFTWDRTARVFRAHYRRIAGRRLTDEDRALISAPPAF